MKRVLLALAIAAGIYGAALGAGTLLYTTGVMPTGATHNNCPDFHHELAPQYGGDAQDVPQSAVKSAAEHCLSGHTLTEGEAYRTEYVFWSAWPAVLFAVIFLAWPVWAETLHNQDREDGRKEVKRVHSQHGMA
jgi:hypothetical protein